MNTFKKAESALLDVLVKLKIPVVALSGSWGIGKTHLWRQVEKRLLEDGASPPPIYISLFGLKSISELKLRIVQAGALKGGESFKQFQKGVGTVVKGLFGKFLPGASIEDLVILSVPNLVSNRLVVIDDAERKHKSLDIDEVMGFVNDLAENHSTQFLFLLNTDKLADADVWQTLHEKVIETEILLRPTSSEAFEVARQHSDSPHLKAIEESLAVLQITNIRVIRRVFRVVKRVLGSKALSPNTLQRTVPITVLFTCLHYKAVDNGPSIDYVLTHNWFEKAFRKDESADPTEAGWDELLRKLRIHSIDEYDELLATYMRTGMIDDQQLARVIADFEKQRGDQALHATVDKLFTDFFWDQTFMPEAGLARIRGFAGDVASLSAPTVTSLESMVRELGDHRLADDLIRTWIEKWRASESARSLEEYSDAEFHQPVSPAIIEAVKKERELRFPPLTLFTAVQRMQSRDGWGRREEEALTRHGVADFELLLRELDGKNLATFTSAMFWLMKIGGLNKELVGALDRYTEACKKICSVPDERLAQILLRAFTRNGFAARLK